LISGSEVLKNPRLNKGTAFTKTEREALGLSGLLPPIISTMKQQVQRALASVRKQPTDIDRYVYLSSLQKRNERLFYRLLIEHTQELMPLVYTPTVGQACEEFAAIFRETAGIYVTFEDRGHIAEVLGNWPEQQVKLIVATDGERILGLGDLGANGMGIPIGKLALYCACAGVDPSECLPVMLDVGTENEKYQNDPLYLGLRRGRVRGEEYDAFVDEFIQAVKSRFPKALLQFEDFATTNAVQLLAKYRDELLCFNDDIQGTAAVVVAGLIASTRGGLVTAGNDSELGSHVTPFMKDLPQMSFADAVRHVQPDVLIGASGTPKVFTQDIIEYLSSIHEAPVIFALSNPTSKAECSAEDAYLWSDGRAVFASGSPFGVVHVNGEIKVPGQGNNAYIFPGLGLGALCGGITRITDEMLIAAAETLAGCVTDKEIAQGCLYPPLHVIRDVSVKIAVAVSRTAVDQGLVSRALPDNYEECIRERLYEPFY